MAAFRLYSKLDTFFDGSAQPLAGGYLKFYQAGTTTPQNVYGEKALTTNNGAQIALDASGRPAHDIWADVANAYFVELYDATNVKQGDADNIEVPGGQAQAVPIPNADEFLTGDGTNYDVENLASRLVPDPTGQANKVLSTDGTALTWISKPADGSTPSLPPLPTGGVTVTTTTATLGKLRFEWGSGSASASNAHTTSAAVTFATAYSATPKIYIQPTGGGVTGDGYYVVPSITSSSSSGFTAGFNVNEDGSESGKNISLPVAYNWLAVGTLP